MYKLTWSVTLFVHTVQFIQQATFGRQYYCKMQLMQISMIFPFKIPIPLQKRLIHMGSSPCSPCEKLSTVDRFLEGSWQTAERWYVTSSPPVLTLKSPHHHTPTLFWLLGASSAAPFIWWRYCLLITTGGIIFCTHREAKHHRRSMFTVACTSLGGTGGYLFLHSSWSKAPYMQHVYSCMCFFRRVERGQ